MLFYMPCVQFFFLYIIYNIMFPPIRARRRSRATKNQTRRRSRTTKNQARRRSRAIRILGQKTRKQHVQHGGNEECSICLADMDPNAIGEFQIRKLKCGHNFHDKCIQRWFAEITIESNKCPLCRGVIKPIDLGIKPVQPVQTEKERELEQAVRDRTRQRTRLMQGL